MGRIALSNSEGRGNSIVMDWGWARRCLTSTAVVRLVHVLRICLSSPGRYSMDWTVVVLMAWDGLIA